MLINYIFSVKRLILYQTLTYETSHTDKVMDLQNFQNFLERFVMPIAAIQLIIGHFSYNKLNITKYDSILPLLLCYTLT